MSKKRVKKNRGYAKKRKRGNMMYGPGCCAHGVTASQVAATKERAKGARK